jgi:hypothetical protein
MPERIQRNVMPKFIPISMLLLAPVALYAQASGHQSGTVKSVEGSTLTLTTAAGAAVTVTVPADAAVLQLEPGSKDLKSAAKTTLAELAVGDRVLVTTAPDNPGKAMRIIVIKSGDIAARNAAEAADWQRRGSSGIVKAVNGAVVTVAVGSRVEMVDTTPATIFRRYAEDSVKFQDAKPGALNQINPGDQLSARGDKSTDGSTIEAAEVVTGSFENLSGLLTAVDPAAGTLTLKDLTTKKVVTVKVTANSDLRNLPAGVAARFAARSKAGAAPAGGGSAGGQQGHARAAGMDLSRMLNSLPVQPIGELHAGDAVMIVASKGAGMQPTAITMLSGVEPILSASPSGAEAITLSPWNLGAPDAGAGGGS